MALFSFSTGRRSDCGQGLSCKVGLKVWYDEFELHIGDSLRRKIDQGLAKSRFGIVVISPDFIRKGWTNYELDGLITRAVTGDQILLPIWHHISKKEVI